MKILKFVAHSAPYYPGERAAFDDQRADELVRAGAAVLDEQTEPEAAEPAPEPESAVTPEAKRKRR